jgi:hypothetical protein
MLGQRLIIYYNSFLTHTLPGYFNIITISGFPDLADTNIEYVLKDAWQDEIFLSRKND